MLHEEQLLDILNPLKTMEISPCILTDNTLIHLLFMTDLLTHKHNRNHTQILLHNVLRC